MAYKGTIVIPTTHDDAEYYIEQVAERLAKEYGGYSQYTGKGGWIDDDGNLIEEEHVRIETVSDDLTVDFLRGLADYVKAGLEEGAVFVSITQTDRRIF